MEYNLYQSICIFFVYGFLGWCSEVAYAACNSGKFVNRGFLNGAICPIYGFGVLTVVSLLNRYQDNLLILFVASVVLTSLLEFVTGWLLEKFFHTKWWDYSKTPFNIKGYICLKFSLVWGLVCVFIVKVIHPLIMKFIDSIPHTLGVALIWILSITLIVDFILTLIAILKLPKKLKIAAEFENAIRHMSDSVGTGIYEGAINIKDKNVEFVNNIKNNPSSKSVELREKYQKLMNKNRIIHKRILTAFPNLSNKANQLQVDFIKKYHKTKHKKTDK